MPKQRLRGIKYYSPKRRAIYAQGEQINHLEIFERDAWICQLCLRPVDRRVRYPSWWCATIDHIVPLSLMGTHTKENVQLAHRRCNETKGNRLGPLDSIQMNYRKNFLDFAKSDNLGRPANTV